MYVNTCTKCGQGFETKNPNRVVCPTCLYPDRAQGGNTPAQAAMHAGHAQHQGRGGYAPAGYGPPQGGPGRPMGVPSQGGGYGPRPGYGPPGRPPQGGFGGPRPGGGGFGRPGFGGRPGGGRPGGPPARRPGGPPKKLLIPKEVLIQIEELYKPLLPLPNPDAHEIIAQKLNIEPSKAFFGMNLVRMKLKLPKLEYPKRKLAVTPDQLMAIETMYTPYMTMDNPPIGIHKIIAKQLKLDEWRTHVAIGLIRKAKNMPRWNAERDDLPPQMKAHLEELAQSAKEESSAVTEPTQAVEVVKEDPKETPVAPEKKRKTSVKKIKAATEEEPIPPAADSPELVVSESSATGIVPSLKETEEEVGIPATVIPKKRGRPKKATSA